MRLQTAFLICMCVAALALGLVAAAGEVVVLERSPAAAHPSGPQTAGRSVGVDCTRPRRLRLVRFEDGSAQLRCAERILVRVSVPQR